MKNICVIESYDPNQEWGISFDGFNPEAEYYFKMPDKETAFRLEAFIKAQEKDLVASESNTDESSSLLFDVLDGSMSPLITTEPTPPTIRLSSGNSIGQ